MAAPMGADTDDKQMASEIVHAPDRYEIKLDRWGAARVAPAGPPPHGKLRPPAQGTGRGGGALPL